LLDELDKIKDICVQNLEKEGEEQEQTSKKVIFLESRRK